MGFKTGTKCINIAGAHKGSAWPIGSICTVVTVSEDKYLVTFDSDTYDSIYMRFFDQLVPLNSFFKRLYRIK